VLIVGAGCSHEPPTDLPLAGQCARESHQQLVVDGILGENDCADPSDLSALAKAVVRRTGRQRALVERMGVTVPQFRTPATALFYASTDPRIPPRTLSLRWFDSRMAWYTLKAGKTSLRGLTSAMGDDVLTGEGPMKSRLVLGTSGFSLPGQGRAGPLPRLPKSLAMENMKRTLQRKRLDVESMLARIGNPGLGNRRTNEAAGKEHMNKSLGILLAGIVIGALIGSPRPQVRRVGMVIGIKPEKIAQYKALHADSNSGVRDLLTKYHMRNFSIYLRRLDDGKDYLFGYYEYDGQDYQADMSHLAAEPRNQKWLSVTDRLQAPLRGKKSWAMMELVYHNE